jgi:hypothetical protein
MPDIPDDIEFTPTEVTVSEQFTKRWDDQSQIWRLLRIEGRHKLIMDEWIGTPDIWRIKRNFGGGRYILQPMDDRGKYVPGSHSFALPGRKKDPDNPEEVEDQDGAPDAAGGNDYMLKYLIEEKRRLEDKLEHQAYISEQKPTAKTSTFDADEMSEFIDALMKKKIAYKAMAPIISALDADSPKDTSKEQIRTMLEMLEKGLSLGKEMSGGANGSSDSSLIEKVLLSLAPRLFDSRSQAQSKISDVLAQIPSEQFNPPQPPNLSIPDSGAGATDGEETAANMMYAKLERAIRVMVDMLDSERQFSEPEISENIKSILPLSDIKLLGSNFSYDALIHITQAEPELRLIIMEQEDRVKKVIDLLRSDATGKDAGTSSQA